VFAFHTPEVRDFLTAGVLMFLEGHPADGCASTRCR
jgi:hypothetical protein